MRIQVQDAAFDLGAETERFAKAQDAAGAVVTFTGIVRNNADGTLKCMRIEHYPGMTEKALQKIADQAQERWDLTDLLIIHRHGDMVPGEMIMMVATASKHRLHAFEAAEYLMDYLKSRAPFWKKEMTADGAEWVAAKDSDEDALSRW
ncbi:molybdopterin synthase catalytic subunit MoaE [Cognatishimia maritima]|uniref:Molybdopterin synthase catalytic subunit n=1 Tax=Cognatishimia maritima TaxID=870908 RepID=A0A1M5RNI9_9RHOB|nr:molybdopterin synthase catalytic subunit MoaE [Cognatishimia maritima]SHH27746.1 molybdopterin synthase subunit MoaE [Cognatishimia maritima]